MKSFLFIAAYALVIFVVLATGPKKRKPVDKVTGRGGDFAG
jgi:hypothetical protein